MTDHVRGSLADFADSCAAKTPTPGGGAASAMIAAVGAGLGVMAARFTLGKKGFEEYSDELESAISSLEDLRSHLTPLVDEDCAAYDQVTAAFKLPRETAEEKSSRSDAVQQATLSAMETPMEGVRLCAKALEVISSISSRLNRNLASDAGVCALALHTGLEGLAMNVRINASSLSDQEVVASTLEELARLRAHASQARDATIAFVEGAL